jgi:hypothetical protein
MATTEKPHISRNNLRAFHSDLQAVIVLAVNEYGVRYRLNNNNILLYAPDGTDILKINARNTTRDVRKVRTWFARHVVGIDEKGNPINPLVKDPMVVIDDVDKRVDRVALKELAEVLNGPEHPVEDKPEPEPEPEAVIEEPEPEVSSEEPEWVQYRTRDAAYPNWETDGTNYRCVHCGWITDSNKSLGGHSRMRHRDTEDIHGPEARAKANETRKAQRLIENIETAVEYLASSIGMSLASDRTAELEAEIATLRERCGEIEAITRERDDALAKLALIKEATGL